MGRKPVLIELCGDFCYVLGADIVGGVLKVVLADLMGNIVKFHEEPIRIVKGARAVLKQLLAALKNIVAASGIPREKIWVAVIGTPGIFDPETGKSRITFFLEGWDNIDIRKEVFDCISIETLIENDVNLDVIGESWKGVGKDYENILYVKLGQGLAARVVVQNKLLRGYHNMAGEIGYMMPGLPDGASVNYENLLCNDAVSKKYREYKGTNKADTISDLFELANKGDKPAAKVAGDLLRQFSIVLLNSASVLDPQVIILGGDACCFGEKEIITLKKLMEQHLPPAQNIVPSMLDKKACIFGAIKRGLDQVEERIINIW